MEIGVLCHSWHQVMPRKITVSLYEVQVKTLACCAYLFTYSTQHDKLKTVTDGIARAEVNVLHNCIENTLGDTFVVAMSHELNNKRNQCRHSLQFLLLHAFCQRLYIFEHSLQ